MNSDYLNYVIKHIDENIKTAIPAWGTNYSYLLIDIISMNTDDFYTFIRKNAKKTVQRFNDIALEQKITAETKRKILLRLLKWFATLVWCRKDILENPAVILDNYDKSLVRAFVPPFVELNDPRMVLEIAGRYGESWRHRKYFIASLSKVVDKMIDPYFQYETDNDYIENEIIRHIDHYVEFV